MAQDFANIEKVMNKLAKRIPEMTQKGMKIAAKQIADDVIDQMPLKTGRLANNWHASRGGRTRYEPHARGSKSQAKERINKQIDALPKGDNLYLDNPTTYGIPAIQRRQGVGAVRQAAIKAHKKSLAKLTKLFDAEIKEVIRGG